MTDWIIPILSGAFVSLIAWACLSEASRRQRKRDKK